jgi:hypothetical protein
LFDGDETSMERHGMKLGSEFSSIAFVVSVLVFLVVNVSHSAPRAPMPPIPSLGIIHYDGFDSAYASRLTVPVDSSVWAESWSGYALDRSAAVVAPFVVPMAVSNHLRLDPERGSVRVWYRPDFSSGNGTVGGLGRPATLMSLVTTDGNVAAAWWSLVVSSDRKTIQLVCEQAEGAAGCLSADVQLNAGEWHLLTLGYTATNSVLYVNDEVAAVGEGLPRVPVGLWAQTGLVLGSRADGSESAAGLFEELTVFSGRNRTRERLGQAFGIGEGWDVVTHYAVLKPAADRGPISEMELSAMAGRKGSPLTPALSPSDGEREFEGEGEGGGGMMLMMGGSVECVTNAPSYITNLTAEWITNQGWTVTFEVQGTNSPVDIFGATNLWGVRWTNAPWVWLERGPSCAWYQYTNQAVTNTFYVLGTTNDTDGEGLTDAYELLVSRTLINNADTDGDGISDYDEVVLGMNPLDLNEIAQSASRINFQYNANGWLTNGFGMWSKAIVLDVEGNIQGVTP